MVRKAEFTQQRLLFVVGALRQMLADENFINLLRAEGLASLPRYLAERVWPTGGAT
jgi:ParB family chromosome partitioning protein